MNNEDLRELLEEIGGKITGVTAEADSLRLTKFWLIYALSNGLENAIKTWADYTGLNSESRKTRGR